MNKLPLEFTPFIHLIDQFDPLQLIFPYYLCLMLVEDGQMQLVETLPGESGLTCIFETTASNRFSVVKPPISKEIEADLIEQLREILTENGL